MGLSLWVIDDMERVASIFSYDFLKNIVDFFVGKSKLSSREGTNYEFVGAMLLLEKLNEMNALDFSKILEEQNSQPRQQKST